MTIFLEQTVIDSTSDHSVKKALNSLRFYKMFFLVLNLSFKKTGFTFVMSVNILLCIS